MLAPSSNVINCLFLAPWETADGWNHRAYRTEFMATERKNQRGYCYSTYKCAHVVLEFTENAGLPDYEYFHSRGASKQVAREMEARALARNLDTLRDWHENGWSWWGVVCEFERYHESCWGIDDDNYAAGEVTTEIALEIAAQMESAGHVIRHKPDTREDYLKARLWRCRCSANEQNCQD